MMDAAALKDKAKGGCRRRPGLFHWWIRVLSSVSSSAKASGSSPRIPKSGLAGEVHRSLVPELSFKTSEFEFFGASFPSGAVGGDLVDVVAGDKGWFAYVADVSGRGVPAGVLMSMTKSAVRMWLSSHSHDSALLSDMNSVLKPLLTPNMFITFAYAAWGRCRRYSPKHRWFQSF